MSIPQNSSVVERTLAALLEMPVAEPVRIDVQHAAPVMSGIKR